MMWSTIKSNPTVRSIALGAGPCLLLVSLMFVGCAAPNNADRAGSEATTNRNAIQDHDNRRMLFESGIDYAEFVDNVNRREEMWHRNTAKGEVPVDLIDRVKRARGQNPPLLHILAVAEDGCSDSANIVPYLAKFVGAIEGMDMRIVNSTVGRDVMQSHRTPDGREATPTIVVLDAEYRELGCLVERPKELQDWALANKNELPSSEFMKQKFSWYDQDLGKQSMSEIVTVIENAGSELVNCGGSQK